MSCINKCIQYKKSERKYNTDNSRYCGTCEIFIEFDSFICPCCKCKLKTKPRHSKRLKDYLEKYPEKAPKRIN